MQKLMAVSLFVAISLQGCASAPYYYPNQHYPNQQYPSYPNQQYPDYSRYPNYSNYPNYPSYPTYPNYPSHPHHQGYGTPTLIIHEEHHAHDGHDHDVPVAERAVGTASDFMLWQHANPDEADFAYHYQHYLQRALGNEVPPMHELLTSARSWRECGYEPYQVPPQELWSNILPTLNLYNALKWRGIIPASAKIRSVYRPPALNQCAGGATGSKHLTNSAIDIWVPEYGDDSPALYQMKDKLCQFWLNEGQRYNFGLGLYATGAIHIDTQGYRKWGLNYSLEGSPCRAILERPPVNGNEQF